MFVCVLVLDADVFTVAENERLPTSLGWSKKEKPVTLQEILLAVQHIRNATNLITGNSTGATASAHATRELHFGGGDL